ncbi:MAG: hypothetical protein WC824_02530 [Bacteroidota bacterium]|jgi:hypothetical protein
MKTFSSAQRFLLLAVMPVVLILVSCQNSTDPTNGTIDGWLGAKYTGNLYGKVTTTGNAAVMGIEVTVGTSVAYTNSKGEFYLEQIPAEKRLLVTFRHTAYATTQKIVAMDRGRTTFVEASVLPATVQNLNAVTGGTVTFNGAMVTFPANALVDANGTTFTGSASVKATFFDPTSTVFTGCFPGEFNGVRTGGSETAIESFGFINVEMSSNGTKLQLASGTLATITVPVPAAVRGRAPQSIPLWYYDEITGRWMEEGSATFNGTAYIGTVAHFTSWNCDQPMQTSYLEGRVIDKNGNPLEWATVHTQGIDYTGSSQVRTTEGGYFKVPVKANAQAKVWASYYILSGPSQDVNTPATGTTLDIGTLTVPVDTSQFCFIIGKIVDNLNQSVQYVTVQLKDLNGKVLDYVSTGQDGSFRFFGESGVSYTLEVKWYADSVYSTITVNVTCPQTPGATIDVGEIKIDVGGAFVTGRVVDASNNPLSGVNVYSKSGNGSPGQSREIRTGNDGRFTISCRPSTTFDIYLYYNQNQKSVTVTSGLLGSTTDIGDVTIP